MLFLLARLTCSLIRSLRDLIVIPMYCIPHFLHVMQYITFLLVQVSILPSDSPAYLCFVAHDCISMSELT